MEQRRKLPNECIESILIHLSQKQRFRIATDFRFWFLQQRDMPRSQVYKMVTFASRDGTVHVLERRKQSGLFMHYNEWAMDLASQQGHVHVLEWWKQSGLELKYSQLSINQASMHGHIHVLDWWKCSGLDPKFYFVQCLDPSVFDWWKQNWPNIRVSLVQLKYKEMHITSSTGNVVAST